MKSLEESAVIRYIENNQYQLTIKQVAKCFDVAMSSIKNVLQKNNIKLKYERNINQTMKHVNEELKKNKEKVEDVFNARKVDPAHIEWYRNKLNINLNLAKNSITVKHTDIGLEDVWEKIKHEYVYTVICPFERTYEIKRRLSDDKIQANSNRGSVERQKNIDNKESVTGSSICGNDNSVSNKRVDTKFKRGNSNMSKINQETKDKFIVYYLEQKKLKKMKKEIATEQTFFSFTTANRVMKDVDSWTKEEWKEFEIRQADRLLLSSKVKEEPVSEIVSEVMNQAIEEQFEVELKDGDIVENEGKKYKFVYTGKHSYEDCSESCDLFDDEKICLCGLYRDKKMVVKGYFVEIAEKEETEDKCLEFDTEPAHIINELSAKNEELQKELHTQKLVIEILQKGINELNEAITESKIMIAEVAKERDSKDEETRVLKLELLKKDNNMDNLVENFRTMETKYKNLLEVLETKKLDIALNPKYDSLYKVLLSAYNQASNGKGKERHANDEDFKEQKIVTLNKQIGSNHGAIFQACKKAQESARLPQDRAIAELLGAINYLVAAVIILQEDK